MHHHHHHYRHHALGTIRGSSYLIVRTEMQYFHIRFHMPLTSSGRKLEQVTVFYKRQRDEGCPRCFLDNASLKTVWMRGAAALLPASTHATPSLSLSLSLHLTTTHVLVLSCFGAKMTNFPSLRLGYFCHCSSLVTLLLSFTPPLWKKKKSWHPSLFWSEGSRAVT